MLAAPVTVVAYDAADLGRRAVYELLALPEPPTALFAGNNRITVGVLRVLGRSGSASRSSASTISSSVRCSRRR